MNAAQREALDAAARLSVVDGRSNHPDPLMAPIVAARIRNLLTVVRPFVLAVRDDFHAGRHADAAADADHAIRQLLAICDALALDPAVVRRMGAALVAAVDEPMPSTERSAR